MCILRYALLSFPHISIVSNRWTRPTSGMAYRFFLLLFGSQGCLQFNTLRHANTAQLLFRIAARYRKQLHFFWEITICPHSSLVPSSDCLDLLISDNALEKGDHIFLCR